MLRPGNCKVAAGWFFLQNGADVNLVNDVGDTPLHRAAFTGREVCQLGSSIHSPLYLTQLAYLLLVIMSLEIPSCILLQQYTKVLLRRSVINPGLSVVIIVISGVQLKIAQCHMLTASSTETGSGPYPLLQAVWDCENSDLSWLGKIVNIR